MAIPNRYYTFVSYSILICLKISFSPEVNAFSKFTSNLRPFPFFNGQSNSSFTKNNKINTIHSNNKTGTGVQLLWNNLFDDDNNTLNRRKFIGGVMITSFLSTLTAAVVQAYTSSTGYYTFEITEFAKEALEEPEKGWDAIEDVTIVFHGAGGQDQYTNELMVNLGKESRKGKSYVVMIDWYDYSQKILKASFEGQRVGKLIAQKILDDAKSMKNLHVIGISVGAFAADSIVSEVKQLLSEENKSDSVYAQLTLLDPFTQRGIIGIKYGADNFGKTADYAQQFLNTDDPVPSTNKPLPYCAVTDVTQLRPTDIFGHDWPLIYYSRSNELGFVSKRGRSDIGSVRFVSKN